MSTDTRKQVLALITQTMARAMAEGRDPWEAAKAEFPGTPGSVLGEAFCAASDSEEEAWWRAIEQTIDGEVIRNAIQQEHRS